MGTGVDPSSRPGTAHQRPTLPCKQPNFIIDSHVSTRDNTWWTSPFLPNACSSYEPSELRATRLPCYQGHQVNAAIEPGAAAKPPTMRHTQRLLYKSFWGRSYDEFKRLSNIGTPIPPLTCPISLPFLQLLILRLSSPQARSHQRPLRPLPTARLPQARVPARLQDHVRC